MITLPALDSVVCQHLAVSLAHLLWQGVAIAALAAVAAALLRSSQHRYAVYLAAMLLMAVCLPVTFVVVVATSTPMSDETVANADVRPDSRTANESNSVLPDDAATFVPTRVQRDATPANSIPPNPDSNAIETTLAPAATLDPPAVAESPVESNSAIWRVVPRYVITAYLLGLVAMLIRVAASFYGGQRLRRDSLAVDDEDLLAIIQRVARRIGLRRAPLVAFCRRVSGPVVIGVLRPVVLLPVSLTTGLTPQQLEAILAHEFSHLLRYDHVVLVLQRLVEALLFFHPAVWYVSRCLSTERENCCDDAVIATGAPRVAYAELLLKLAERKSIDPAATMVLAAAGDKPSRLRNRVARILNPPGKPIVRLGRAGTIAIVCLLAAIAIPPTLSFVLAQPASQDVKRETPSVHGRRFDPKLGDIAEQTVLPEATADSNSSRETKPTVGEPSGRYRIELSGDTWLELTGITAHPQPHGWWKANGEPITEPLVSDYTPVQPPNVPDGKMWREVQFRGRLVSSDRGTSVQITPSTGGGPSGTTYTEIPDPELNGEFIDFAHHDVLLLPESAEQIDFTIRVADGVWETVASSTAAGCDSNHVHFEPVAAKGRRASLRATFDVPDGEVRLFVEDNDGQRHPTAHVSASLGQIERRTVGALPLDRIRSVHLQWRPYRWFTFRSVSMHARRAAIGGQGKIDTERAGVKAGAKSGDTSDSLIVLRENKTTDLSPTLPGDKFDFKTGNVADQGDGGKQQKGANLAFLSDVPDFSDLGLAITEEQLKQIVERHKLVSRTEKTEKQTTYTLYNPKGECVVVMFRDGKCSGIQRLRTDPDFGISKPITAATHNYAIQLVGTEGVKLEMLLVTLEGGGAQLQRDSRMVTVPFEKEFRAKAYHAWFNTLPGGASGKVGDRFESRLVIDGELQGGGFGGTIKAPNKQTYSSGDLLEHLTTVKDGNDDEGKVAAKWGEPLLGLRMRLTASSGNNYRRGKRLPLLVEMQNVTDKPISFEELHPRCDFKVFTEEGDWLGIARRDISISPWEGAEGALASQQILRWHIWFERMWLNKPIAAGSTVQVRVGVPRQIEERGKIPRTNYSVPVLLKLIDVPPILLKGDDNSPQLTLKDVTDRWTDDMDLVYREAGGLFLRSLAIHIDGQGKVTMLNCGGVKGRTETKLNRERLDALAARLHQMKIWELSDVKWRLANPDEGEVRISLTYGGTGIVRDYANGLVRDNKTLAAFKAEMLAVIAEAVKSAAIEKEAGGARPDEQQESRAGDFAEVTRFAFTLKHADAGDVALALRMTKVGPRILDVHVDPRSNRLVVIAPQTSQQALSEWIAAAEEEPEKLKQVFQRKDLEAFRKVVVEAISSAERAIVHARNNENFVRELKEQVAVYQSELKRIDGKVQALSNPPAEGLGSLDKALRATMQLDPTFTVGSSEDRRQGAAIAAWKGFLERRGLTREQQVFAWWRIGSLAAYNFDPNQNEVADSTLAESAFVKVFGIAEDLISNETLYAATVYGGLPGKPADRANRLAKAYRWLFTRQDAMVVESASVINHNGYGIDGQLIRGGMRLDTIAKKQNFLRSALAEHRDILTRRITEEIQYSQDPAAIRKLLTAISDVADDSQMKQWTELLFSVGTKTNEEVRQLSQHQGETRPAENALSDGWSKPVNNLQARLSYARGQKINGTPIVTTYLELRNVSGIVRVMEIPFELERMVFSVKDAKGNVVAEPTVKIYDGTSAPFGVLRLPYDTSLKFTVATRGAPIAKDHAAHLDLGPDYHWSFKRGDERELFLHATLKIEKSESQYWFGTIHIPKQRIPVREPDSQPNTTVRDKP